jgi:dGTPase
MLVDRKAIEERERKQLAPYAMKASESRGRQYPEEPHSYRTAFQRDRDRIVHSTAFRRLEYKTQVFVNHEGDYYRTRLTHTMEGAQISRSIARALGLNEDLTEAIALAHDLGHTPFGHAGQDALDALLQRAEFKGSPSRFEHNRQSLRIIDLLEARYPGFPGLNLSYEVRESLAKHSQASSNVPCEGFAPAPFPLLEAQVADATDAIAYHNHDLDDGLKAGLIQEGQLRDVELWRRATAQIERKHPNLPERIRRHPKITFLINLLVGDLLEETDRRLNAHRIQSPEQVRRAPTPTASFSPEMERQKAELNAFLYKNLYHHYRVRRMQIKAQRFLEELFQEYYRNPDQLPPEYQERLPSSGVKQVVTDYLAGMTDRFAQEEYRRLFHPFEKV